MNLLTEFKEAVLIAWAAIRANKMRAALTTLGIVIGIVTVTLMGSAIAGLNATFKRSISGIGADVLYIQRFSWFMGEDEWRASRNRRELTRQNARDIERLSEMARAVGVESNGNGTVEFERRRAKGVFCGGQQRALPRRAWPEPDCRPLAVGFRRPGGSPGLCGSVRISPRSFSRSAAPSAARSSSTTCPLR